jgi:hypothetical protein
VLQVVDRGQEPAHFSAAQHTGKFVLLPGARNGEEEVRLAQNCARQEVNRAERSGV